MKRVIQNDEERRDRHLLENSIERVINTTIKILEGYDLTDASEEEGENVFMNLEDWNALKWTVVHVWNEARNEAFKRAQEEK